MARLLLTTSLCCSVGIVASIGQAKAAATVSSTEQTFSFSIPAQSLDGALAAFSKITHIQTVAAGELTRSARSPGISGTMTPTAAMNVLLGGTGLSPRTSGNVIIVQKAAANITLGPVRVGGSLNAHEAAIGPGVGYVATYSEAGTKMDTPITEIPNSVYVITKQEILDQQAQTVNEALRYMPGVYAERLGTANVSTAGGNANGTGSVMMRGFAATQYVDGIMSSSSSAGETAFVERVETLNGPASVLYGQVGPGGLIATRLKQPGETPVHNVSVGFGNHGRYEATFDVGDKITKSGNLKYRIAGIGVTQGSQTDYLHYKRVGVLPSIKWDIDDKTSLTLIGQYMYTPEDGQDTGYPSIGSLVPGTHGYLPRSLYLGDPAYNTSGERDAAFEYQFQHKFNKFIEFQQTFRYEDSSTHINNLYLFGSIQENGNISRRAWKQNSRDATVALDSRFIEHWNTGPVKQTFVEGMDFRRISIAQNIAYDTSGAGAINVWDPIYYVTHLNYSLYGPDDIELDNMKETQYQSGIYFQDQIKYGHLSVLLGGRQDWYNYKNALITGDNYETDAGHGVVTQPYVYERQNPSDSKFTWRAGLTYNFDFGLTPYFSYATSFIPQTGAFQYNGQAAKPLNGKQFEAGLKYLIPHTNVFLTAAAYHIQENHYQITDMERPGYEADAGTVTSKGVELSAHANVTKDLRLSSSYSFNETRATKSDTSVILRDMAGNNLGTVSEQGKYIAGLPRHMVNMFADYTLPRKIFHGLGVNFGIRYIGSTYADNANSYKVPSYLLFDVGAHYDFENASPLLKGLRAQLAISNLANTRYVTSCSSGYGGGTCYYGQAQRIYGNFSYSW
ncbi:TonB-dependent siderophore receptor [Komagataeibacter sp. AV436]|uniref:TonB-dependent siderophore receptor n=1 Tax=Komagataeibacter melomenusus TaxID=2766578 RepID=A0ABX2ABY8_9PROT|nr:TonB-dependent siderophore receptor [Komagataeibacter melomenusus]MBV1829065.1 TonB-dependent siderophore receptor [Komagataeibacter melomenusus]NPC65740.1 TonB-dependent siderophore receptor [Komagataeibacter melomenusus]